MADAQVSKTCGLHRPCGFDSHPRHMLPVIISFGPIKIYAYALFFLLAFVLFWFVVWKRGRELHFEESDLFDATIMIIVWGILGSRLAFVLLVSFKEFGWNLLNWLNFMGKPGIWQGGLLVCAGIAAYFQAKRRKWDLYNLTDVLLTALVLFQAIMAFGEFLNGSHYGITANNFFGLRFGGMQDKHLPVQLYTSVLYTIVFIFLIWVEGKYRTFSWYKGTKSEASSGFITSMYFILIGLIGLLLYLTKMPYMVWWGIRLDVLWELAYLLFGGFLLYRRSAANVTKSYSDWTGKIGERRLGAGTEKEAPDKTNKQNTSRWSSDIFN